VARSASPELRPLAAGGVDIRANPGFDDIYMTAVEAALHNPCQSGKTHLLELLNQTNDRTAATHLGIEITEVGDDFCAGVCPWTSARASRSASCTVG
jgi:hypothetical protein